MKHHRLNYYFLGFAAALILLGLLFLANLSAPASLQTFGTTNYYIFHQLYAFAIGLVLALILFKVPLDTIKKIAPFLFLANIALLMIVFLPSLGVKLLGAKRWISIGNNTLQPSELLKINAILYISSLLSKRLSEPNKKNLLARAKGSYENFIRAFLPFVAILMIIGIILLLQRDLSTLGVIIAALLVIYFTAQTPLWHTIVTVTGGLAGAFFFIHIEPYRFQRLFVFLHPETDPLGIGFQLRQSLLAIGSGGIFGKGWGMSTQKFGFLPQAMSDSVFAIIGEETGLVGCFVLIVLFLLFCWQGIKIAYNANDRFSKMVVTGIMTWLITQAFMNIGSSMGLFPLAGIPLPFFSYGGSHLIAEMASIGLVLNISKHG